MSDQERRLNEVLDILGLPRDTAYRDYARELVERGASLNAAYFAERYGNRGDLAGGSEPLNPDLTPFQAPCPPPSAEGTTTPASAEEAGCAMAPSTRPVSLGDQHRRRPAPLLDARRDGRDLRIRVGPCVFRIRDQPIDPPALDLVGRPRPLVSVAISRACARTRASSALSSPQPRTTSRGNRGSARPLPFRKNDMLTGEPAGRRRRKQ
jgi:hypothetical protein